ncbi:hypothetical protein [Streptomyces sp. HUAS TT20]|uniref:hypothetical protein n=1 Tax=Streptomyces sp. HUAS TT20 TaxID=3447509 RepID=UPI0021D98166|nr:hypothetical protein [Streptomyces sp. HUAS 15-9]UXY26015.1 hypothetical protein N8I87_05105 [Streptomyces sp. HUAS 15-9]
MSRHITPPPMPGYGPPVPPPQSPRKTNTIIIAAAAAVVAAVVSSAITVGVTKSDGVEASPTVTVTEVGTDSDGAAAADESTDPTPEDTGDGVFALDDTVTYESDVEVSLSGFKRSVTGEYAEPEKTAYVRFTVKVKNGGSKTLDSTMLSVNCSYGQDGHTSDSVFDSEHGLGGGPDTKVLAGRSLNVPWGCVLPKNEKLIQIEVSPDMESETAIFTGDVE